MYGIVEGPPVCCLLEYCSGGDLFKALHVAQKETVRLLVLQPEAQLSIACEIASALAYIHSKNMLHRDIKSPNVLLAEPIAGTSCTPLVKLADFGLSKNAQSVNTFG